MSRYFKADIIDNTPLQSKTGLLTIKPLERVPTPLPGQFYMLAVSNVHDPLLKRPFSFFRGTSDGIQFLYEVRGKGTMKMKDFRGGEVIDVLGPLGKGYPEPEHKNIPLLIAGGIGVASIFPLIKTHSDKAYIFYGARNRDGLVLLNEITTLSDKLFISTDDGSMGQKGTVVDILTDFLNSRLPVPGSHLTMYACGRRAMLEAISRLALERGIKGYVSAEEHMACGVGACLGCAIKTRKKEKREKRKSTNKVNAIHIYKMVCKDGPVFSIEEIVW